MKNHRQALNIADVFLDYILLINVGFFSLLSAYGHIFMGPEIAKEIGWPAGSPFQFEVGIGNLSYGILRIILAVWLKGGFGQATVVGWSLFLLGAFIGHMIQEHSSGNRDPYNFGVFVWFNDLFLPFLTLFLLFLLKRSRKSI